MAVRHSVSGQVAPSAILHILEFLYKFDTDLYQFLEIGISDRPNIGRDHLLKILGFSLHPFNFSLNSPLYN